MNTPADLNVLSTRGTHSTLHMACHDRGLGCNPLILRCHATLGAQKVR